MKKKILAIVLCVAMLAVAIVGSTMAYFTDEHEQTNTFTAGKVGISLDEAVVVKDEDKNSSTYGDLIAKGDGSRTSDQQAYHLYPAMTVTKDPTIKVDSDSEDAYVAAIVTITGDVYDLMPVPGYDNLDITLIASGGLVSQQSEQKQNWNGLSMVYETEDCVIYQDASDAANNVWTLYIFMKDAQPAGSTITLFDTLTIDEDWNNAEMAKINGMEITVAAYATQTNGFVDCFTAVTTAFAEAFDFS